MVNMDKHPTQYTSEEVMALTDKLFITASKIEDDQQRRLMREAAALLLNRETTIIQIRLMLGPFKDGIS